MEEINENSNGIHGFESSDAEIFSESDSFEIDSEDAPLTPEYPQIKRGFFSDSSTTTSGEISPMIQRIQFNSKKNEYSDNKIQEMNYNNTANPNFSEEKGIQQNEINSFSSSRPPTYATISTSPIRVTDPPQHI